MNEAELFWMGMCGLMALIMLADVVLANWQAGRIKRLERELAAARAGTAKSLVQPWWDGVADDVVGWEAFGVWEAWLKSQMPGYAAEAYEDADDAGAWKANLYRIFQRFGELPHAPPLDPELHVYLIGPLPNAENEQ